LPCPEVGLVLGLDELGSNSDLVRIAPHAALDYILDAQLAPDLVQRLLAVLVMHHGSPRNDS
jgi:hypothetical protein